MFETTLLLLALVTPASTDTVELDPGRSLLWSRRPAVRVVVTAPDSLRLTLTARDPQFFTTTRLLLRTAKHDSATVIAEIQSDSSSIDARFSANRHTLWFRVTRAQLIEWSHGSSPTLQVGRTRFALDAMGRARLAELAGRLAPSPAH